MTSKNLKHNLFLSVLINFLFSNISFSASMESPSLSKTKNFLISLPILTMGREGTLRAETNLANQASLALEWIEWGQTEPRQELGTKEMLQNPSNTLATRGQDLGVMLSRFSEPSLMSGFHWGLGAGYRVSQIHWIKGGDNKNFSDEETLLTNYSLNASGTTLSGRVGYRYVAPELGFAIGTYFGIKHFQSQIKNKADPLDETYDALTYNDSRSLKRRMMTQPRIGIEAGWAF